MRLTDKYVDESGAAVKLSLSGAGIIIHLHANAESRRSFRRLCERSGLVATPVEHNAHADGTFNRRTGERIRETEAQPTAFQVIGDGPALRSLTTHPCVAEWAYAMAVRVPVIAGGNGEEKPRPSSGTSFGKPNQVKATQTQLAKQTADAVKRLIPSAV
jgi:hypothetical protein